MLNQHQRTCVEPHICPPLLSNTIVPQKAMLLSQMGPQFQYAHYIAHVNSYGSDIISSCPTTVHVWAVE